MYAENGRGTAVTDQALEKLSEHGLVIVEFGPIDVPTAKRHLTDLQSVFGNPIGHRHADDDGHVIFSSAAYDDDVRRPQSDSGQQSPHTDGVFGEPPPIIALVSVQTAAEGGESIYIHGGTVIDHMYSNHPNQLPPLLEHDAVRVQRGTEEASNPVFRLNEDGRRILVAFSHHEYNQAIPSQEAEEGFNSISRFVRNRRNWHTMQPRSGQLTIISNLEWFHGRRKWNEILGQERTSVRGWFDNNPSQGQGLQLGVQVVSPATARVRELARGRQ